VPPKPIAPKGDTGQVLKLPGTGSIADSRRSTQQRRNPASVLAASTFSAGILLLPSDLQADARQLYYLLRTVDDLVDENDPRAAQRVGAIEQWTRSEQVDSPETRTLTDLSRRYPLRPDALAEFCKGMRHDLARTAIETENDLELYCHYVGGTVGIMLTALLGTSHPEGETKMATLGAAMQCTNILRDIDEDLAHDRIYIARSTIERFGFPHPAHEKTSYAIRSPAPTHSTRTASVRYHYLLAVAELWASQRPSTGRSCARSNEAATVAHPGASSCPLGASAY